jgi:endonuclease/exonuclease/phosphatase (EEP) superfamily protein YafD
MLHVLALVLGGATVIATALSLLRFKVWWIRIWDFPRVQVALMGVAALALGAAAGWLRGWPVVGLAAIVAAAVVFQGALVWRYTRLAPREVQPTKRAEGAPRISLVISNVLQTNRDAERLLGVVRDCDPDVVLCVETDRWWEARLDALVPTHCHVVRAPLSNTYGMLLYSRLPLEGAEVNFLVEPDIPSIQARVRLEDGTLVWLNCVHPRPPAPGESDESLERDAELLLVGKRVRDARLPVIVCGDLNDVAWSRTTRLFQKVSRLVDPRKGRGFYSTFHARWPGLRYPLDHVFHSDDFRLVALGRLPYVGSDHFPVYVEVSHEPEASAEQDAPAESAADLREAHETIREERASE